MSTNEQKPDSHEPDASLPITDVGRRDVSAAEAEKVKGGAGRFEINDYSFGVEHPTTIGSATGGAGSGKLP